MHVTTAVASAMLAGAGYFWLTVCVGLALVGLAISVRIVSKGSFGDTLSRVLMIPFVNILLLCLIARYVADSSTTQIARHARTAGIEPRVVSVASSVPLQ